MRMSRKPAHFYGPEPAIKESLRNEPRAHSDSINSYFLERGPKDYANSAVRQIFATAGGNQTAERFVRLPGLNIRTAGTCQLSSAPI
jgi:hypothetical protein